MKRFLVKTSFFSLLAVPLTASAQDFSLHRAEDGAEVFTGTLGAEYSDPSTKMAVQTADFSAFNEPGEYYLEVPDVGRSVSFRIGPDVYDGELANVMLGFYGWRSGIDIAFDHNGVRFEHAAGHLQDALLDFVDGQVGVVKDGVGGWYDAGDYGKYLPTASISVNSMLVAWDLNAEKLAKLSLPFIPETGAGLPDYLDELKFEIDWMLKMAAPDGQVHHKIMSPQFPAFVAPKDDPTKRFFAGYSTAATGEFVATLAKAARVFQPYDELTSGYSEQLLAAARLSYTYLREHPENVQYDMKVLPSGEYQKTGADDRLWAAAEFWEATGDAEALADFEAQVKPATSFKPNFDWNDTTNYGLLTYVMSKREGRNPELLARLTTSLETVVDGIVAATKASGYGRGYESYYWGTNGVIARTCILLLGANALKPNPAYVDACTDQIGYLYGRNQYNRSQITGSGIEPPLEPHHRPSGADKVKEPYPGLLVGGGQTALGWTDVESSFGSNEVAINWNAALAMALASFYSGESAPSLGRGPVPAEACQVRVSSAGYLPDRAKVATIQPECELPNSFMCEVTDETMSGDIDGPVRMIDDFEDADQKILVKDGRKGSWSTFDDGTDGTVSKIEIKPAERDGSKSKSALCVSGGGFTMWGGGLAMPLNREGMTGKPIDASDYTGLSFWAKGAGKLKVMVVDQFSDPAGMRCASCNDHFFYEFELTEEWEKISFSWNDVKQSGFGDPQPDTCPAGLYAINFQWGSKADFDFCLDDVAFTTPTGTAAEKPTKAASKPASDGGCSLLVPGGATSKGALASLFVIGLALLGRAARRRKPQA